MWLPISAPHSHVCPACGLRGDRDVVSAALAACVEVIDPGDPATARVNYELAHALRAGLASQQEGRAQSTGTSHHHHLMLDRPGPAATTTRWSLLSKQHSAHPRTDQTHSLDVAGSAENNQPPS